MLESNKIPYYALSFVVLAVGVVMLLVNGLIYIVMVISNSTSEIQPVKNKCIIASIIVSVGVALFTITLALDYNKVFV
jgi:hypothetical protein